MAANPGGAQGRGEYKGGVCLKVSCLTLDDKLSDNLPLRRLSFYEQTMWLVGVGG